MEINCQLDATDGFYCRSYCLLNMFRSPLCPSSGAREYYTGGCCLGALIFKLAVWCVAEGYVSGLRAAVPHYTDNLKTKAPNITGSRHLYNTFELLMMGIMVPETCWTSNNICNKNHLLHLVDILFPRIFLVLFGFEIIFRAWADVKIFLKLLWFW